MTAPAAGADYYLDSENGDDANTGLEADAAWATLAKASGADLGPGDRVLLRRGDRFGGKLAILGKQGSVDRPIMVEPWGLGARPLIDAKGYLAGIHLQDAHHVHVRGLEITADGGVTLDGSDSTERYGVLARASSGGAIGGLRLSDLVIHDIFPETGAEHEGRTSTTYLGTGILLSGTQSTVSSGFLIERCDIRRTGFKAVEMWRIEDAHMLDTMMTDIGGPAIQPGRVTGLVVRGNTVDGSGSYSDPRMHGRGSGIWPWNSRDILIEHNRFMHARGRLDSCGVHIDFHCSDVVVQYNLSVDNEGGFVEILGNNHNCTYRYNISVNDGARRRGLGGAGQDGRTLWTAGWVGEGNPPDGPNDIYIYNNTIYMDAGQRAGFMFENSTDGFLVANNVFHLIGPSANLALGDDWRDLSTDRVVWTNNLYLRSNTLPPSLPFSDANPLFGDAGFKKPGGDAITDYVPLRHHVVRDRGVAIDALPGDAVGLKVGLAVERDILGNPIVGAPDLGAIEVAGDPPELPVEATFAHSPSAPGPDRVEMAGVEAYRPVEYRFVETTGNLGGDDSGWGSEPRYVDDGLLPNTTYAYQVRMREPGGQEIPPGPSFEVRTALARPFRERILIAEDFSSGFFIGNQAPPFLPGTWFLDDSAEWMRDSVPSGSAGMVYRGMNGSDRALRLGWGFDETVVTCFVDDRWEHTGTWRLSGEWSIAEVLDLHLGFQAGFGVFDPETGQLMERIMMTTFGEFDQPVVDQSGRFELELNAEDLPDFTRIVGARIGVVLHHDDDGRPESDGPWGAGRNDVYVIDGIELRRLADQSDLDEDGIPDAAEAAWNLSPDDPSDAAWDPDGDGFTNGSEYLAGTDPGQASFLSMVPAPFDGGVLFRVPRIHLNRGRLMILERSPEVGARAEWIAIDAFPIDDTTEGRDRYFLPDAASSRRFYRLRVEWAN